MTIKELIQQLQQLDPDLHVFVHGYEGGYDDVTISEEKEIALNVNEEWYYGSHEDAKDTPNPSMHVIVKGIVL